MACRAIFNLLYKISKKKKKIKKSDALKNFFNKRVIKKKVACWGMALLMGFRK